MTTEERHPFSIYIDEIERAYWECALWSSTVVLDETGAHTEPMDANYGIDDVHPATKVSHRTDIIAFVTDEELADALDDMAPARIGHDFWLTRNHHGAGFWDRGLGAAGELLTKAAHVYGSVDLWIDDEGKVRGA